MPYILKDNIYLHWDMGTGKTFASIMTINSLLKDNPCSRILIVCPKRVTTQWEAELEKHSNLTAIIIEGVKKKRDELWKFDHYLWVMGHDLVIYEKQNIIDKKFTYIILDEIHKFKTPKAKRTFFMGNRLKPERVLALSGTMIINNLLDLYGQWNIIKKGLLEWSFANFKKKYFNNVSRSPNFPIWVPKAGAEQQLKDLIKPYTLTIRKEDVLDLPGRIYKKYTVEMDAYQRKVYKEIAAGGQYINTIIANKLVKYQKLNQITKGFIYKDNKESVNLDINNTRLKVLLDTLEGQSKVVIFYLYHYDRDLLRENLKDYTEDWQEFQNTDIKYFLGNTKACSHGIELFKANLCIFYSQDISYGDRVQAEARLHRIGQVNHVTYIDLVCLGTIDEIIVNALIRKGKLAERMTEKSFLKIIEEDLDKVD